MNEKKQKGGFPQQNLPNSKKTRDWCIQCVDWAKGTSSVVSSSSVRHSIARKKINYDLMNGIVHEEDMLAFFNPYGFEDADAPGKIQHFPIINSKINVLLGEESRRPFDYRVIVTNPTAVSDMEEMKKQQVMENIMAVMESGITDEAELKEAFNEIQHRYAYKWQDLREIRGNAFLKHYSSELSLPLMFNKGFLDALIVGEEIYRCDIVAGEPTIERLDPMKVRVFKSGSSGSIEDADIVVVEDYWSPSRILDIYGDSLSREEIDKIHSGSSSGFIGGEGDNFTVAEMFGRFGIHYSGPNDTAIYNGNDVVTRLTPYDFEGNVRVMQVYWKSIRQVKKITSIDPMTGAEVSTLMPSDYKVDELAGETAKIMYINEAWEGVLIGDDIYANLGPRKIQFNRLSNPSKCHFGIVGSIYNLSEDKPYSLVDMMKPYSYMYNLVHDKLNKIIYDNIGKVVQLDMAKLPATMTYEKWWSVLRKMKMVVTNSFEEGKTGVAKGKLAGALNNNVAASIDLDLSSSIMNHIQLLTSIKEEMSDVAGISRQREGQIYNRETVGGVERATLQSSYITEWIFTIHEDVKKRALECFLEVAKISLRYGSKKFEYILPDQSRQIMSVGGEEFAECDYGITIDSSRGTMEINQKLDMLAQAALQNQAIDFSAIIKLYQSTSISEKASIIEQGEQAMRQRQAEQMQAQQQAEQQAAEQQMQLKMAELDLKDRISQREVDAQLEIAKMKEAFGFGQTIFRIDDDVFSEEEQKTLEQSDRQFDEKMKLEKEKLEANNKYKQRQLEIQEQAAKAASAKVASGKKK